MKRNEIIELNGNEYTLELNRESFLKIDQYSNIQESMSIIRKDLYEHIEEIEDGENPFENAIDDDELERNAEAKINALHKIIERAFWIWLYPNHQLKISEVKKILEPYFKDDEKFQFLSEKYGEYMQKSIEVRNNHIEERKNLKALANKN